jgi:hypothetical protein
MGKRGIRRVLVETVTVRSSFTLVSVDICGRGLDFKIIEPVLPHGVLSQGMTLSITAAVAVVCTAVADSVPVQHDFYVATASFSFIILQKSLWSTSSVNTERNGYFMLVDISTTIGMSLADCVGVV